MGNYASQHQEESEEEEVVEGNNNDKDEKSPNSRTVMNLRTLTFNEQDLISPTNDDCLLKVLEHCDWKTLGFVFPQLSRRFNSLSDHPSYPILRKSYYTLSIVQDRFYDGFFLDPHKETEERTLVYKVLRGYNKANDTKEVRRLMDKGERFVDKTPTKWPNPEVQIPDRLFDNIRSINKRYNYERVHIHGINFNESFVLRCLETFAKNRLESMEVHNCTFAASNEQMQDLFLKLNLRRLLVHCEEIDPLLFTEDFVRNFSKNFDICELDLFVMRWARNKVYWSPSPEFFPIICKFTELHLDLINLETNLLVELIMLRFSLPFDSANFRGICWYLSLTRQPTIRDLFNIDRRKFHVDGWKITQKLSGIQCSITLTSDLAVAQYQFTDDIWNRFKTVYIRFSHVPDNET